MTRPGEKTEIPSAGSIRPIVVAVLLSIVVAILSAWSAFAGLLPKIGTEIAWNFAVLVPSTARISAATLDPNAAQIVLSAQWALFPVHLLSWFYAGLPWSRKVRRSAEIKARTLKGSQRVLFAVGYIFLGAWLLGDFGLIDFPTLYNGGYVYPPESAVPQLHIIYTSNFVLTVYAWMSPLMEVGCLWMFLLFTFNFRAYAFP